MFLKILLEVKLVNKNVLDNVIAMVSINESLSLVAVVHGSPAELIICLLSLHEAPDRTTHYRYRVLVRQDQDLAGLIDINSWTEELTC